MYICIYLDIYIYRSYTLTSRRYLDITACPSLQVLSAPATEKSETPGQPQHQRVVSSGVQPRSKEPHWSTYLDTSVLSLPRTRTIFDKLEGDLRLSYSLPRLRSSAGQILQHGIRVIQKALDQKRPCTFKIGFSHNPIYRYYNEQFGYFFGKDRFEGLCVLYISHEPTGPAFLEAALIHHFNGDFPAQSLFEDVYLLYIYICDACHGMLKLPILSFCSGSMYIYIENSLALAQVNLVWRMNVLVVRQFRKPMVVICRGHIARTLYIGLSKGLQIEREPRHKVPLYSRALPYKECTGWDQDAEKWLGVYTSRNAWTKSK